VGGREHWLVRGRRTVEKLMGEMAEATMMVDGEGQKENFLFVQSGESTELVDVLTTLELPSLFLLMPGLSGNRYGGGFRGGRDRRTRDSDIDSKILGRGGVRATCVAGKKRETDIGRASVHARDKASGFNNHGMSRRGEASERGKGGADCGNGVTDVVVESAVVGASAGKEMVAIGVNGLAANTRSEVSGHAREA
jgi:hypothetical protein